MRIALRKVLTSLMASEFLTTKELAELLRIKERKVYDLAASGTVPCSKAMGKLLFPRDAINAWIAEHSSGLASTGGQALPNVFLGSHDPLLEWALRESQCGIATYFDGSADGLKRFSIGEGIAAGMHLYDASVDQWNTPIVQREHGHLSAVLVQWATRQRGLIIRSAMQQQIRSIEDLAGRRVVPRQAESGAQVLLTQILSDAGISAIQDDSESAEAGGNAIQYTTPVRSEADAALQVLEGKADAAFGLQALAVQYGLGFVEVIEERFDLLIDRRSWFEPTLQTFVRFCRSEQFFKRAEEFAGYDLSAFGHVHFNGPG